MNRRKFIKTMLIGAGACVVPGAVISKIAVKKKVISDDDLFLRFGMKTLKSLENQPLMGELINKQLIMPRPAPIRTMTKIDPETKSSGIPKNILDGYEKAHKVGIDYREMILNIQKENKEMLGIIWE